MKRFHPYFLFSVVVFIVLATVQSYAQSTTATSTKSDSDQVMKELLNEVRQLRVALQRINTATYRTQLTLERMRLQQEQVTGLSKELATVRNQLDVARSRQVNVNTQLEVLEKRKDAGLISADDTELRMIKLAGEEAKHSEQTLTARESELVSQLATEQLKLDELNKRLDDLESEVTSASEAKQPSKPKD